MNAIIDEGLICIFRGVPREKLIATAKAVYNGGVRVVEVAFNPADPNTAKTTAEYISTIVNEVPELTVGAGTVVNTDLVKAAYNAGAKFIFSPNLNLDVVKLTKELGMISIPGAFTPSECAAAYDAGADIVKLFPITIKDVDYVKGIMRPLNYIPFICVGGTNENTIEAFFEAGAFGVGTGISILKPELIEAGDYDAITELAKIHVAKVKECQKKYR